MKGESHKILFRGGVLVGGGKSQKADLLVAGGLIAEIGEGLKADAQTEIIDAEGAILTYGLADVHVHLREPGFEAKETIATGSRAAARGGYTVVCAMPNLNPAPDSPETLALERSAIERDAVIDVRPYATITLGRKGGEVVDVERLAPLVAGFSDDGSGVQEGETMAKAMQLVKTFDGIIAAHCEDNSLLHGGYIHEGEYARTHNHRGICSESEWGQIERDVKLATESGCRYHVCHISTRESVDIIRRARTSGANITCETAPHYLTLTDADLQEDGRFKMNPPLRSEDDRKALIEGILDGTIEVVATDHAPHTAEEKSRGLEGSAMGIVGLETAFAVLYTRLVESGTISLEHLIALMCDNPRRIFRLGGKLEVGQSADLALFDISSPYTIDSAEFRSKGKATPFEGWRVKGRCRLTLKNGRKVWEDKNK